MRLELRFIQQKNGNSPGRNRPGPNKHSIQGLIYDALTDTNYQNIHDKTITKQFTYSDWFHSRGNGGNRNWFFISSPDNDLIETLNDVFRPQINQLQFLEYKLVDVIPFDTKNTRYLKTGSPIVLQNKNGKSPYHSFRDQTIGLHEFEMIVKNTLIRQYRASTNNEDFDIDGRLFEQLELRKEVAVPVTIRGTTFPVIGSTWHKIILAKSPERDEFYRWLTDMGIGQKTSLGFGFLQPFQLSKKHRSMYVG